MGIKIINKRDEYADVLGKIMRNYKLFYGINGDIWHETNCP